MASDPHPLVSILTPVYNTGRYLAECIESVLAQSYGNWEYLIVNNCSTDDSLEIARRYAKKDSRIRVHDNTEFLGMEANLNAALRRISARSSYTKFVLADDWIFPRCVEDMVAVAETHPSIGLVGCYGLDGSHVVWDGLPYPGTFMPGRNICRLFFLEKIYVLGTPTSLLYRSDLVRTHDPFYNELNTHSDTETCIRLLCEHDFGFVHQVLAFSRQQAGSQREVAKRTNTLLAARLFELSRYGADFLSAEELRFCQNRNLTEYYNFLAVSVIRGNFDRDFWTLHRSTLGQYGFGFRRGRILGAILARLARALLSPLETLRKLGTPSR